MGHHLQPALAKSNDLAMRLFLKSGRIAGSPLGKAVMWWVEPHSSKSLRLGVRLGSLARKPNTKIPIKKKTTE